MREGWKTARMSEVFELQMGKTPSRDNPNYWGGLCVWVAIGDMNSAKYISDSKEHISSTAVAESGIKQVPSGCVIMSFKLSVGKVAVTSVPVFTNEAIMAFKVRDGYELLPDYIYYYLKGYKWDGVNRAAMGLTLNKASISQGKFSYPKKIEQERIVAELDLLTGIIDKQKAQLKELDTLAQSIFYDMFGDPVENEKGWQQSCYGEQFTIGSGGTPSKSNDAYWNSGTIPWIGSNMCQNCIINKTDGKFITEEGVAHSSAKLLDEGTVLVALVGATIGKVALLQTKTCTNQNIAHILVQGNKNFAPIFVYYQLQSLYSFFMELGNGDFKMANLSFIRSLPMILPPLTLQQSFAQKIQSIESQKASINRSIAETQKLFDYTMDKYFG